MMEDILRELGSRQPDGAEVKCEMRTSGNKITADLHYHTNGWVVYKLYGIEMTRLGVAIYLISFKIERS